MNKKVNGYRGIYATHKYWGKKPPELCEKIIKNFSKEKDLVVDPFMGSGVLGRICKENNRKFIGSDINPSALNIAEVFINPPNQELVSEVLNKLSKEAAPEILSLYKTSLGEEVTHIIRNDQNIEEVWIKDGNKTKIYNKKLDFLVKEACPKNPNFLNDKLFKNSRINVGVNQEVSSLFTDRSLKSIEILLQTIESMNTEEKKIALFILTSAVGQMSKMVFAIKNRKKNTEKNFEVGSWVIGFWKPKIFFEINVWRIFVRRANKLLKALSEISTSKSKIKPADLFLKDGFQVLKDLNGNHVDLIITDPPHNDRIPYLELSAIWNNILYEKPDYKNEWVLSNAQSRNKGEKEYLGKLEMFFKLSKDALKKDGLLILIFNTTNQKIWEKLKIFPESYGLHFIGKFPGEYTAQSVVQDNREGALKYDWCLVYSRNKILKLDNNKISGWSRKWEN